MSAKARAHELPWHQRTFRWAQVNLTEIDALDFDTAKWMRHFAETHTQGLIVNAGGVVAYYPTRVQGHPKAAHLGDRDLFGEIIKAAREAGLTVLARMDCSRGVAELHELHPDWFAKDADGNTYHTGTHYLSCVNAPFFKTFIPDILREICELYAPDGFADNSWSGLGRRSICYCDHCRKAFETSRGMTLPQQSDFSDHVYREWIRWSYECRLANWDLFNETTHAAGGPDCHWIGMVHADPLSGHVNFCDLREVGQRADILLSDQQSRIPGSGFEQNSLNGKLLHALSSWNTPVAESMALYTRGERTFRLSAAPPAESRQWIWEGISGGIDPWWHVVGARAYEKRRLAIVRPIAEWHAQNERFLRNREPVAEVGMLWSHANIDFYGRDDARTRVQLPWQGWMHACIRSRIPFLPINARDIPCSAEHINVLILPDFAAIGDNEAEALHAFVQAGGSLVVTGRSGTLDTDGEPRSTPALDDLLGIFRETGSPVRAGDGIQNWESSDAHTYLLLPDRSDGRHPLLAGLDGTDLIAFGGNLERFQPRNATAVAGFVPNFPIYPPEFAWIRNTEPATPTLLARELHNGSRLVTFAADLDRCYGLRRLPDHRILMKNALDWARNDAHPVSVDAPGILDVNLYRQESRLILHLVNNSSTQAWPDYPEDIVPLRDLQITIRKDLTDAVTFVRATVSGQELDHEGTEAGWTLFLPRLDAHEMILIE